MKKMKKILALIMVMAMVLGMGLTAAAVETTNVTVTVSNEEGADLYYDQIVSPDTTSTDGWKYETDYEDFFKNIIIGDLIVNISIEDLIEIADPNADPKTNGSAADGILTTSASLAKALEDLRATVQEKGTKVTGNSFTAASGGLYVVIAEESGYTYSPTLVYVPVNQKGETEVQTKGAPDQINKKLSDEQDTITAGSTSSLGASVFPGEVVSYTVTVKYPYISANYTGATFKIIDNITKGTLVIDDDNDRVVEIKIGNADAGNLTDASNLFKVTGNINGRTDFTIEIDGYDSTKAGQDIVITYWVKADEDVSSLNQLTNKVRSELDLIPEGDPDIPDKITEHKVISDTVKVNFDKVDENVTGNKLTGAVFALYEGVADDGNEDTLITIVADANSAADIVLPTGYDRNLLDIDENADGSFEIDGLDGAKSYYLVEIIAPIGYSVDSTPQQLTGGGLKAGYPQKYNEVNEETGVTTVVTEYQYEDFKVNDNGYITNTTLSSLPSTGGIGTTIFTVGGCLIMIAAAALYFMNRRRDEE